MEPEALFNTIAVVTAIVAPLTMMLWSLFRPPSWVADGPLAPFWRSLNFLAFGTAVSSSALTFWLYSSYMPEFRLVAILATSLLTFIFTQTLFTDFAQRKADRWVLRIAIGIALIAGFWFLNVYNPQLTTLYLIYLVAASATLFVPAIGDSDARAIILIIAAAFPVIADKLQYGVIGVFACALLFSIGTAIQKKSFKAGFSRKLSLPMVPMIVLPFIALIAVNPLYP